MQPDAPELSLAAQIDQAKAARDHALMVRDLAACVVANYLADRIENIDNFAQLAGVKIPVEVYRARRADHTAKRRHLEQLMRQQRDQRPAEDMTDQAAAAIADLMIFDAQLRGRMPEVTS